MDRIDLCLTDDHQIFRKAMMRLLKTFDRIGEVYEAGNGEECLEIVKGKKPQVVLLDLDMPIMNGSECAEQLVKKFPDVKIIVLTSHDSEKYMLYMLELGVNSFLLKNTDPEELEKAIYAVTDNDFYHNELLNSVIRKSLKDRLISARPNFITEHSISEREREILKMICDEISLKDIASRLAVSEKTIQTHKLNIQSKLNVRSTVGLVKAAYEIGLIN
ncbi:MAG TPA: response regulator transcription factor [Cyclobacteriaceae bacterium]|jgi:DNA-binding NarL/FixJ family response regulator|nr:response regulator transcription factor [Cyclobacteriaceae bacterium]